MRSGPPAGEEHDGTHRRAKSRNPADGGGRTRHGLVRGRPHDTGESRVTWSITAYLSGTPCRRAVASTSWNALRMPSGRNNRTGECKSENAHYSTRENSVGARLEDSTATVVRRRCSNFERLGTRCMRYRPYDRIGRKKPSRIGSVVCGFP